jgi:hypothetical protein
MKKTKKGKPGRQPWSDKKRMRYFTRKYGQGFVQDFQKLGRNPLVALDDIGKKYSLTRERIRQLVPFFLGESYGDIIKRKIAIRRAGSIDVCKNDPRYKAANHLKHNHKTAAVAELKVLKKLQDLDIPFEIPCTRIFDLKINGYNADVKSAKKAGYTSGMQKVPFFRMSVSKKQWELCDFFICYIYPTDTFYIIPKVRATSRSHIYIPQGPSDHWTAKNHKYYSQFREAWYLLTT